MSKVERKRRRFTPEFKADIVKLILDGRKSVPDVARQHEIHEAVIYTWVRQAKVDRGEGRPDELTTAEKQELSQLRKEVRELRRERDFLKSAAAYFAQMEKKRGSV